MVFYWGIQLTTLFIRFHPPLCLRAITMALLLHTNWVITVQYESEWVNLTWSLILPLGSINFVPFYRITWTRVFWSYFDLASQSYFNKQNTSSCAWGSYMNVPPLLRLTKQSIALLYFSNTKLFRETKSWSMLLVVRRFRFGFDSRKQDVVLQYICHTGTNWKCVFIAYPFPRSKSISPAYSETKRIAFFYAFVLGYICHLK